MHASLGAIGRLGTVDDDEPPIDEKDEITDSLDDIKENNSFRGEISKRNNPWQRSSCDYYTLLSTEKFKALKSYYKISNYLPIISPFTSHPGAHVECASPTLQSLSKITSLLRIYSDLVSIYSYREAKSLYQEMFDLTAHFTRLISQEFHSYRESHDWMSQLRCYSFGISPLNNVRSICETVREYMCETSSLFRKISSLSLNLNYASSSLFKEAVDPSERLFINISYYSTFITLLGHYLLYAGMIRLSNLDVNRSTHQELWDMSRGVEELNILTTQLKGLRLRSREQSGRKEIFDFCSRLTLEDIIIQLANLRANRLVHIIKEQVINSPSFVHFIRYGNVKGYDNFEEHHNYLLKSSHLMSADYLRNEYEFSSAILDVFSQSTELFRELRSSMFRPGKDQQKKSDLYELKEKNRSSLVDKKDIYSVRQYAESSWSNNKLFYSYSMEDSKELQNSCIDETRHSMRRRMSTFNSPKKVRTEGASGFVLSDRQLTSVDFDYDLTLEEFNKDVSIRRQNIRNTNKSRAYKEKLAELNETEETPKDSAWGSSSSPRKKMVQWSDFEEVPLRHQAVGRYLELVWWNVSNKLLREWLNPYPSRTEKVSESSGAFIKSLNKQISHSSDMDYQGYLSTGILFLDNEQLRRFSQFINIITRSEIFPNGLLPILKHQSAQISYLADQADFIKYSYPKLVMKNSPSISDQTETLDLPHRNKSLRRILAIKKDSESFLRKHFVYSLNIIRQIAVIFDCDANDLVEIDLLFKTIHRPVETNKSDVLHLGTLNHFIGAIKFNVLRIKAYMTAYLPIMLNIQNELTCLDYIDLALERYKSLMRWKYLTTLQRSVMESLISAWNKVSGWMENEETTRMVSHFPHDDKKTGMSTQLTSSIVTKSLQAILRDLKGLESSIFDLDVSFLRHFRNKCSKLMMEDLSYRLDPRSIKVHDFSFVSLRYFTEMNQIIFDASNQRDEFGLVWHKHLHQVLLMIFDIFFHQWTICIDKINVDEETPLHDLIPIDRIENILIAFEVNQQIPEVTGRSGTYANLKKMLAPIKDR